MDAPQRFQLRAKNVSLTYPQCNLDKRDVFDRLHALIGNNLSGLLVAVERHADGNPHLHCFIRGYNAISTRDSRFFDLDGYHPNVQSCRSQRSWIRYCLKEDPEPLTKGLDLTLYGDRENTSTLVARRLLAGDPVHSLLQEYPGFFMCNLRKAFDFESYASRSRLLGAKSDFNLVSLVPHNDDGNIQLAHWLTSNLRQERPLRTKQLWLYGPPGSGKTSLVMALEAYLHVYWVCQDMDFYDGFDDSYDLIVYDEMKSQKKLTHLNNVITGAPTRLNVKGSTSYKTKNMPVIFLSNVHPEQAYTKWSPQRDAFIDRLTIIQCEKVRVELQLLDLNK